MPKWINLRILNLIIFCFSLSVFLKSIDPINFNPVKNIESDYYFISRVDHFICEEWVECG